MDVLSNVLVLTIAFTLSFYPHLMLCGRKKWWKPSWFRMLSTIRALELRGCVRAQSERRARQSACGGHGAWRGRCGAHTPPRGPPGTSRYTKTPNNTCYSLTTHTYKKNHLTTPVPTTLRFKHFNVTVILIYVPKRQCCKCQDLKKTNVTCNFVTELLREIKGICSRSMMEWKMLRESFVFIFI